MSRLLLIDHDERFARQLERYTAEVGCQLTCFSSLRAGQRSGLMETSSVVLLSEHMPDGDSLEAIERLCQVPNGPEVLLVTDHISLNSAKKAIRSGAWGYMTKQDLLDRNAAPLLHALRCHAEKIQTSDQIKRLRPEEVIGQSSAMLNCFEKLAYAARSEASVLINGRTGTGKELFARAIHNHSARKQGNLVVVDCAAMPEKLIESLLFGHEKGVYTGASHARSGLVAQADKGSLFLDEIGEMPLTTQKILLRVLQERRFRPVGAAKEMASDFRLIAATNRNLDQMAAQGAFRWDLLYRLQTIKIELPALCERKEDIRPLCSHFVDKICRRQEMDPKNLSQDILDSLYAYPWPGNVRELINALETAVASAGREEVLFSCHLPIYIRIKTAQSAVMAFQGNRPLANPAAFDAVTADDLPKFKSFRRKMSTQIEKEYLKNLLQTVRSDVKQAMKISHLSRSRFYELLKVHDLQSACHI
jgi:two-component system NtrC family response regulator